jgi:N-acetylmuramoyl-L-alanine amidase
MYKFFSKSLLIYLSMTTALFASSFKCDEEIACPYFRSRNGAEINTLVLHYTAGNTRRALDYFTGKLNVEVSAHYMTDPQGQTYQLVDPSNSAFHAGMSYWNGTENINDNSIGIENVNFGYWRDDLYQRYSPEELDIDVIDACQNRWVFYPQEQITSLISLAKFIVTEYGIQPKNVVGHSDIAPGRKQDPGPAFPWEQLAQEEIGAWPIERPLYNLQQPSDHSVPWVQEHLHMYGYNSPLNGSFDEQTQNTVKAFQMHFDPLTLNFGMIDQSLVDKLSRLVDQHCFE